MFSNIWILGGFLKQKCLVLQANFSVKYVLLVLSKHIILLFS